MSRHPTRPMGYRKDAPQNLDRRGLRYATGIVPNTFSGRKLDLPDHMPFRGRRIYQVGQSCVAFSLKRDIYMSMRMLTGDDKAPMISALWNYAMAIFKENEILKDPSFKLQDFGCYPSLAMRAAHDEGYMRESHYADVDGNAVPRNPPPRLDHYAFDQRSLDWTYIENTHDFAFIKSMADAMRNGWSLMVPRDVDTNYLWHTGSGVIDRIDPNHIEGGHMQVPLTIALDGTKIREDNWWGDWGDEQGTGWVSTDLYQSKFFGGAYCVRYAPGFSD